MRKVIALFFVLVFGLSDIAVNAMPFLPDVGSSGLVTQVAGGCGAGRHRGPYGGCRSNGWYNGGYWGYYGGRTWAGGAPPGYPVPAGPYPCGGRGRHRVCGPGGCVMVCN
jgi:hypothetical protein